MFNWLRELIEIRKESNICETCEVLKLEMERLRLDNSKLLDRILNAPTTNKVEVEYKESKPLMTQSIPWNVKRQMLEQEDRAKARILQEQANQNIKVPKKIEEIEKEMGIEDAQQG